MHIQNEQVALSAVANPAEMLCYFNSTPAHSAASVIGESPNLFIVYYAFLFWSLGILDKLSMFLYIRRKICSSTYKSVFKTDICQELEHAVAVS